MEHYRAIKMSKLQLHVTAWMDSQNYVELVSLILTKRSQTQIDNKEPGKLSYSVYQFILRWEKYKEK